MIPAKVRGLNFYQRGLHRDSQSQQDFEVMLLGFIKMYFQLLILDASFKLLC